MSFWWLFSSTAFYQALFTLLWVHRYLRTIVHFWSHWRYKSVQIPANPNYTAKDVTVIIPTIHNNFPDLRDSIQSILACNPYELRLVTTSNKYNKLVKFTKTLEASNIRVFQTPIANKRIQVCEAIPEVKTSIIIMADDDVTWPSTILPWLLAPFEDARMGGVGPNQRVKRIRSGPLLARCYNWLGAAYIERRNFEISATHGIDGGTSCMSGRTCAFRAEILMSSLFLEGFKTERWGPYTLNADDDNFVTRWLVSKQWKTWIQYHRECEIETTLENNMKFLYQCSRWARSNWRSNYTSLVTEGYVWRQQRWCTYALHIATFTSLSFAFDPIIILLTLRAFRDLPGNGQKYCLYAQLAFMMWTKVIKLVGLFMREPSDIMFLPLSILFGYFHGFIKIWAAATLRMTSWGSRADGDTNDSQRMAPRPRRSESITLPPGNHPGLILYKDDKSYVPPSPQEKPDPAPSIHSEYQSESDMDAVSIRLSYEVNDSNDSNDSSSDYSSDCSSVSE